ncbi:MAG TPA: hypothetical protein VLH08_10960, partial [Acidobacteriota bacterium]|nr:hypothetical protein [Acidobacteriota bacterium]
QSVVEHHRNSENFVTLVVIPKELSGYNPLSFDAASLRLIDGAGSKCHYTGLQIVNRSVIEKIPNDRKTEIFRDIYPELIAQNKVGVFLYDGLWMEMGTLSEFLKCAISLNQTPLPLHLSPPGMKPSLISSNAKLETGCEVSDTIIMDGAVVDSDVKLQRCIVGSEVHVKKSYKGAALARGFLPWYL